MSTFTENSKKTFDEHFTQVVNLIPSHFHAIRDYYSGAAGGLPETGWTQTQDPEYAIQWRKLDSGEWLVTMHHIIFPSVVCVGTAVIAPTGRYFAGVQIEEEGEQVGIMEGEMERMAQEDDLSDEDNNRYDNEGMPQE